MTSGSKYATLSLSVPLFNSLMDHLEQSQKFTEIEGKKVPSLSSVKEASKVIFEKFAKYYDCSSDTYTKISKIRLLLSDLSR